MRLGIQIPLMQRGCRPLLLCSHLLCFRSQCVLQPMQGRCVLRSVRSGIDPDADDTADLRRLRRRMKTVAAKYAEAIESLKRNMRPVAKVAREFGLNANVFRQYLHKHEPELIKQHGHGT